MTLGEIIKKYLDDSGMSQREFAKRCGGVSYGYISMLVRGENPRTGRPIKPNIEKVASIASGMGLTLDTLLRMADDFPLELTPRAGPRLPAGVVPIENMEPTKIRLIGDVAAGQPILAQEDYETYVDSPVSCDYALRVKGDSMTPQFEDGDVIYIREQPDVVDGTVAVVLIDEEATLKRVYHRPNGLQLIANNPSYAPIDVIGSEHEYVRILGIVCGFTRMFKN